MFNLIITIISIALVAVLAIATIYYGGSAFTQGSAKAKASTLVAHAQQITAANTLYANDHGGGFAADTDALQTSSYLTAVPKSADAAAYTLASNKVTTTLGATGKTICEEVNKTLNNTVDLTVVGAESTAQYGCYASNVTAGSEAYAFFYKG